MVVSATEVSDATGVFDDFAGAIVSVGWWYWRSVSVVPEPSQWDYVIKPNCFSEKKSFEVLHG